MIKQLSVLVSNNPGNLFNVVEILKENNIECYGLSTYDATDFGVFHMIVDDPDRCSEKVAGSIPAGSLHQKSPQNLVNRGLRGFLHVKNVCRF